MTISGVSDPVGISLSGDASARWSKNGGSFRSAPGTVQNGDTVYVRLLVPASGEASVTVTVGSYSTVYTVSPR